MVDLGGLSGLVAGAERWPRYRLRPDLRAQRVGHSFIHGGRLYADGYVVRGADESFTVIPVAEFEMLYERAD